MAAAIAISALHKAMAATMSFDDIGDSGVAARLVATSEACSMPSDVVLDDSGGGRLFVCSTMLVTTDVTCVVRTPATDVTRVMGTVIRSGVRVGIVGVVKGAGGVTGGRRPRPG